MNVQGSNEHVHGTIDARVGTISLNRPERRNALSELMIDGLAELLGQMIESSDVDVIVLTGAGGAFCAGGDVQQFDDQGGEGAGSSEIDPVAVARQRQQQRDTVGRIYHSRKPVIASLPGAVAGAGMGLALAADFRIGCDRTVFATAFGGVGLSGDYGVTWLLNQLVGAARTRELLILNPRIDAERASDLGLLTSIVEDLEPQTAEFAERLARGPLLAHEYMLQNTRHAVSATLEQSMDAEVPLHMACGLTPEHIEAVRAFVDKRGPGSPRPH